MRPANRWRERAAATTPRPIRNRPPRAPRRSSNVSHPLASDARRPSASLAESLSAVADRNILGLARGRHHVRPILEIRMAPAARVAPLPALGTKTNTWCRRSGLVVCLPLTGSKKRYRAHVLPKGPRLLGEP